MAKNKPPLPTKDQLRTFITESPTPVGKREIARAFQVKGEDRIALKAMLRELSAEGTVGKIKKSAPPTGRMAEVMPYPPNTISMKGAAGPFGDYISMGGLFTIVKVRDKLKGYDEVRKAPDPLVATQMALLRVLHAADMPDPGTLAKTLETMAANGHMPVHTSNGAGRDEGALPAAPASHEAWQRFMAQKDVPLPYAANLEALSLPSVEDIVKAAKAVAYK